jgi:hypothetical protein
LAFGLAKRGRHYPYLPVDPSSWPTNRWGQVEPSDVPDGVDVFPSITNVTSIVGGGDGLLYWAAEEAIRALYRDGFPTEVNRAVELHRGAHRVKRDERAEEGNRAHTLAERLVLDQPLQSSVSEVDEAYADGFMSWWTDFEPVLLASETTVYNADQEYAGTGDLFVEIGGTVTYVDLKTKGKRPKKGSPVAYTGHLLQAGAIYGAWEIATEGDGGWSLSAAPKVEAAQVVVLYPDGGYDV